MKEYIKPQAELIEYSFEDVIAGSREVEGNTPEIEEVLPFFSE